MEVASDVRAEMALPVDASSTYEGFEHRHPLQQRNQSKTLQQPLEQALVGFVVADPVPHGMVCPCVLLASVRRLESSAPGDSPLLTRLSDCFG